MKRSDKKAWYSHQGTVIVFIILRALVVPTGVLSVLRGDRESVFISVITFFLLLLPSIISRKLRIELPSTLEIFLLCFIFAATILGEINKFYVRVPHWDTVLHTINGFCFAAIGFSLVDMLNRHERVSLRLSPLFLAIVAFCFSMTIGVLWEFYEYAGDRFFVLDMQKDTVIHEFNSVSLDETQNNIPVRVTDIRDVAVIHSDGSMQPLGLGGYLDVGIHDTMKDLLVNMVGAIVFSAIGYCFVKQKGKGKFAPRFIPRVLTDGEKEASPVTTTGTEGSGQSAAGPGNTD